MAPKNRNKRIAILLGFGIIGLVGVVLLLTALGRNTQFFYDPSEIVAADFSPASDIIRVGGLVLPGTLVSDGNLTVDFVVADFPKDVPQEDLMKSVTDSSARIRISYTGTLPDLFREGQGIVATGRLAAVDHLIANEILAKHDENYQPVKD